MLVREMLLKKVVNINYPAGGSRRSRDVFSQISAMPFERSRELIRAQVVKVVFNPITRVFDCRTRNG